MHHPLQQKLASVRTRTRRLVMVYGLSWIAAAALATGLVLGLGDYLFRFQDRGLRLIATLAFVWVVAWTCYRYLYVGLSIRWRDVDLARRIERRFPFLNDGLTSAVEFLQQREDEPTAGSVALRRAVVASAVADTEPLDFQDVVQPRPARRAALVAAGIGLVVLIVVLFNPSASRTAVARLVNPFNDVAWPQVYHLVVRDPVDRIARGQAFEVEVVDRAGIRLPPDVRIHYRFENPDGTTAEETERMQFTGSSMIARREGVTRSFWYRAEGGDDHSMPWLYVEVLEPPELESVSVALSPPEYSGWPAERTTSDITALVGTRVEITARSTKPLESAVVHWPGGRNVLGRLADDGLTVTCPAPASDPLIVEESGSYWFELTDRDRLSGGADERWEIRAVADAPPGVSIEDPSANLFVTPEATVPVRVAAKDDLAIGRIALKFGRQGNDPPSETTINLYEGPERVEPQSAGLSSEAELGEQQVVSYEWDLGPLELVPGDQVAVVATASDYRPQSAESEPRRLVIIAPEELATRIADRQASILAELARVLEMQRSGRSQVAALEIQLEEVGRLDQHGVDRLRGAELNQRQVNRTLTSPAEGVPALVRGLLAELANNKIDSPDVRRSMEGLLAEIERLQREHLPAINHQLTAAAKAARINLDERLAEPAPSEDPPTEEPGVQPDPTVAEPLSAAGRHQDAVIASLEEMLGELSQWASYRRFHREIGQLLRDQGELNEQTAEIGRRTLTKELRDLTPHEVAQLRAANRDQLELARQLDRVLQDMEQTTAELRETDPLAAENVSDALFRARELGVSGQMRSAADHVDRNRMGQAFGLQQQIVSSLREVLDILSNRRESELERLVEKLREAERDLADLARRQGAVQSQAKEAAGEAAEQQRRDKLETLRREQQELEQETERMARRLERLTADSAGQSTRQAAEKMQAAGRHAGDDDGKRAAEEAGEAAEKLDEARRQVAEKLRQAEADLAMEQLAQLEDALGGIRGRQETVLDETQRLDDLAAAQGELTRGQTASLHDLAREQQMLQTETTGLSEKLVGAAVFNLALAGTAGDMGRAAGLLGRRETGEAAQEAQRHALDRLDQLLEALKREEAEEGDPSGGGQGGSGNQPPGMSPAAAFQALAELKLLKMMQGEVNLRTEQLEETFGKTGNITDDARREYEQLSREQGRLADLILSLIPPQGDPEDDPDGLPNFPQNRTQEVIP